MGKNSIQNPKNIENKSKNKLKGKTVQRGVPPPRSSVYRGVTRHRWTGRYEAHLWDKNCWNETQNKKGRQVYLGAYNDEEAAAHAYDLAALKYWGQDTILNFPYCNYQKEFKEMESQSKEEYIGSLRRKSSGFSRGVSKYRGVARHHHNGRWEARIGRVYGNKYLYLGTYATQEEAATAYDMAAIEYRGLNAVTNFDLSRYVECSSLKTDDSNISSPNPNNKSSNFSPNQDQSWDSIETMNTLALTASGQGISEQTSDCNSPFNMSEADIVLPKSYFPEDVQTCFDFQNSERFDEENNIIFGDYDSFVLPMFQCELDV